MKDVDSAAAASTDLDDVFEWIERSSVHAQVWKDFCSASRDGDTDKPVVVNAALKYTFLQVCETMLADALEQETEPEPEHVEVKGLGCVGQNGKFANAANSNTSLYARASALRVPWWTKSHRESV